MRTSLYSILCIVIRLGALMFFVQTLVALPLFWNSLRGADFGSAEGMLIGLGVAVTALMSALWLYPGLLARLASSRASYESFESPLAAADLQYIAFAVLGVAFAIEGLTSAIYSGLRLVVGSQTMHVPLMSLMRQEGAALFTYALKCAIGLGLAFGARGLTGLLRHLREHGLPPAMSAESVGESDARTG